MSANDQPHGGPSTMSGPSSETTSETCSLLVVIVNYKTAGLTVKCLETLGPELSTIPGSRCVVVENASGDGEILTQAIADRAWKSWVSLEIVDRNGGFSFGNNRGIQPALESTNPPRYILLLNADTEVHPGALRTLVDFMDRNPSAGIAGSSFENLDGSDWHHAFRFASPLGELEGSLRFGPISKLLGRHAVLRTMEQDRPQQVDWVAGACMIIRREVFDAIGLMDEAYFLYYERSISASRPSGMAGHAGMCLKAGSCISAGKAPRLPSGIGDHPGHLRTGSPRGVVTFARISAYRGPSPPTSLMAWVSPAGGFGASCHANRTQTHPIICSTSGRTAFSLNDLDRYEMTWPDQLIGPVGRDIFKTSSPRMSSA